MGIETVNLYSAFVWLAMLQLAEKGEMVAITPRSFCNGAYFRPFRKTFLENMVLKKIHLFESRSSAFAEDKVLQENIIFHAVKSKNKPDRVEITNNSETDLDDLSELRLVPYEKVVSSQDTENFIYIVTNSLADYLREQMEKFPGDLAEIGLEVSTGLVVDFRLKSYGSEQWEKACQNYAVSVKNLLQQRNRNLPMIPVSLPDGKAIQLSSGGQNILIKEILESFCLRFTPGGLVLYVGDAGDKFIINETQKFREMGIELDPHGKMPDIIIHYQQQDWLVLIEAVTSHGPVNLKRHNELKHLFQSSGRGLVFVTAFPSRREMTRYLAEIAWETEVWLADQPDHMIHFNGERFFKP
jgi:hypothetical protein